MGVSFSDLSAGLPADLVAYLAEMTGCAGVGIETPSQPMVVVFGQAPFSFCVLQLNQNSSTSN